MVGKAVVTFAALVGLYFLLLYPGEIVNLLQLVVDGAHKAAVSLHHLDLHK